MLTPIAPTRHEIRALTGIRGIAACMVVFYHYFQDSLGFGPAHALIAHSYIAVDLFFVLSGFVMALTYAPSFSHEFSGAAYASFLGKRLGRVYPLYFVMAVITAALLYANAMEGGPPSFAELSSNLLMVQAWGFADSIDDPTWSISTEFAAYLAFPALVALILVGRRYRCWLAIGAALATLLALTRLNPIVLDRAGVELYTRGGPLEISEARTIFPLLRCFAGFVLGLAAFRLSKERAFRQVFDWRHTGDVAAVIVVCLWAVQGSDVALELAFVPLVMALASGQSWTARAMGGGVVFWLGEISYSIYLVHRPVANLIRHPLMAIMDAHHIQHAYTIAGVVPLVFTIPLSALTFYWIEKPARDLSRRVMRRRAPSIVADPPAPQSAG
jgi:peptidoglycan/LPS O-acetylase OafA/YrhL